MPTHLHTPTRTQSTQTPTHKHTQTPTHTNPYTQISVTSGVVSRIEVTAYSHGNTDLLALQIGMCERVCVCVGVLYMTVYDDVYLNMLPQSLPPPPHNHTHPHTITQSHNHTITLTQMPPSIVVTVVVQYSMQQVLVWVLPFRALLVLMLRI